MYVVLDRMCVPIETEIYSRSNQFVHIIEDNNNENNKDNNDERKAAASVQVSRIGSLYFLSSSQRENLLFLPIDHGCLVKV